MRKVMMMALIGLSCGCASTVVQTPDGFTLSRKSWIWSSSKIAEVDVLMGTNHIILRGYEQTNTEKLDAIINAAVAGAVQGFKASQGM